MIHFFFFTQTRRKVSARSDSIGYLNTPRWKERCVVVVVVVLFGNRFIYRREKIDLPTTCFYRENYHKRSR